MAFIRVKARRGRRYAYLVESRWEPGATSPRQRVLCYLGPEDRVTLDDVPEAMRGEPAVRRWFGARGAAAATPTLPKEDAERMRTALREALRAPERPVLDELARAGCAAAGTWAYLREVVVPVMHLVGDDWHAERITVADEHVATRAVTDLVRRLRDQEWERSGRRRGDRLRVLLATPEGEPHSLALDVLECRLAALGHRTIVLAGGTPRRDLARRAHESKAQLVLLSATGAEHVAEAFRAADAVLERLPEAVVAVGGQALAALPVPGHDPRVRVVAPPGRTDLDTLLHEASQRQGGGNA